MIFRHSIIWEDSGYTVLARILGHDGSEVQQADVSTIAWTISESTDPATVVASGTLSVAAVIYDTLQTSDDRWSRDTTGFNFAAPMAATSVPSGNKTYQLLYTFTPASGEAYKFPVQLRTRDLYSS